MDQSKFKKTEQKYDELKDSLNKGELTPDEMKKELKKLMVLDENGHYWMIGGKTGKWYIYDGTDWKEKNPFEEEQQFTSKEDILGGEIITSNENDSQETDEYPEEKAAAVEDVTVEGAGTVILVDEKIDQRINCKVCKSEIPIYSIFCHVCGANQKGLTSLSKKAVKTIIKEGELLITSINLMSLFFFIGGLGLILGVLLGATFGVFESFLPGLQSQIPEILKDTRGLIAGGLIFAAIGGIAGFIVSAAAAAVLSSIYNLIAFIFGGIRFKIKQ